MLAPATHEDMGDGTEDVEVRDTSLSLDSVLTVNTSLTPSESHDDGF